MNLSNDDASDPPSGTALSGAALSSSALSLLENYHAVGPGHLVSPSAASALATGSSITPSFALPASSAHAASSGGGNAVAAVATLAMAAASQVEAFLDDEEDTDSRECWGAIIMCTDGSKCDPSFRRGRRHM